MSKNQTWFNLAAQKKKKQYEQMIIKIYDENIEEKPLWNDYGYWIINWIGKLR